MRPLGHISERRPGVYRVRVSLGLDPVTGERRQHSHTINGTKKEAQQYLAQYLADLAHGKAATSGRLTVNAYLDQWLEQDAKTRLSANTYATYVHLLNGHIRPGLGGRRLDQLQPLDIQRVYNHMSQEKGLSPRTVRITHNALATALQQAVRWQLLGTNPARGVSLPTERRREMSVLKPDQVDAFLTAAASTRFGVLFEVAIFTGMRPGELFALQWRDVDWKAGTVTVQRALVRHAKGWAFKEPKTDGSRRSIPLPAAALRHLKAHRQHQAEERLAHGPGYEDHDLIFASETGAPLDGHNVNNRHFKKVIELAGLPAKTRLYDLRHTCATLLMATGLNPKIASARLGHTSITTTLDVYSHVLPSMQQEATDILEKAIYGERRAESQ